MKQNTKRVLSILTVLGMCQTFAFNVMADEEYKSLSMGSMQTVFEKGAQPIYIEPITYDANAEEMPMDDPTTLSYSSSNERVVRVSNEEKMRFVDYGVAVVTAAYNDISTSMLVTVTPNEYNKVGFENTDEYGSSQTVSAEYKRNGEKALMVAGMVTTFRDWNQSGGPEVKAANKETLI